MPPNGPNETTDEAKIDIVAFLLQSNGFPAGGIELKLDPEALDRIEIVKKGLVATAPNFALVQVVGCLAQAPNNKVGADPDERAGRDQGRSADRDSAEDCGGQAAGDQTYQLVSVTPFKPEDAQGPEDGSARPALQGSDRRAAQPDVAADGRRQLRQLSPGEVSSLASLKKPHEET